jgi:hypothetical protein
MASLLERYAGKIDGVLGCYDRVVIQGTLPGLCYAQGMTTHLFGLNVRVFDYTQFAEPLRASIVANAKQIAAAEGLEIEFIKRSKGFRKEDRIHEILAKRGDHKGLVHIFSAMETCTSYKPWHDKKTGKTFLKPDSGRCLHYYFYFIDPEFGLCFLRVPTWCPFRLQFYFNGHNPLAAKLKKQGIAYKLVDNAFVEVADFTAAQKVSDEMDIKPLHRRLDRYAEMFCPPVKELQMYMITAAGPRSGPPRGA